MEGPDGPLGVLLQIVEVRRVVAVRHSVQNAQMNLERLLHLVEDAPDAACRRVAGRLLHLAIAEQVYVELGPDLLQRLRQGHAVIVRALLDGIRSQVIRQYLAEYRAVVGRSEERRVGKECRSRWSP